MDTNSYIFANNHDRYTVQAAFGRIHKDLSLIGEVFGKLGDPECLALAEELQMKSLGVMRRLRIAAAIPYFTPKEEAEELPEEGEE